MASREPAKPVIKNEGGVAPKRRIVTDKFGKMMVVIVSAPAQVEAKVVDDLESSTLSEKEKIEFEHNFNKPKPDERSVGSVESGSVRSTRSARSLRSGITEAERVAAMHEGIMMANVLEEAYSTHRKKILATMKFDTPLAALHDMAAQYKQVVHFEYHEVRTPNEPSRFLAEIFAGSRKGYGEASTKKLAAHMAAAHLLRRLAALNKFNIPAFYLIPGCRINPRIFMDLYVLCEVLEVQKPMYVLQPKDPELRDGPLFTVKCQIGHMISIGESDCFSLAKRLAAKQAFEGLSGKEVPLDFIASGLACTALIDANIKASASDLKKAAIKRRMQIFHDELKEADDAAPQLPVPVPARERNVDADFNEDMDLAMDLGHGEQPYFGGIENAQSTRARMNKIVENMAEDVKRKINTLRISSTKNNKKKDGSGENSKNRK